jgi:hypothetical protein
MAQFIYIYRFKASHGEEVGHHGAEARRETGLSDETELKFGQANDVIATLPVPTGNVQEVSLQKRMNSF